MSRIGRFAIFIMAVALVAAACSSSGDDSSAPATGTGEAGVVMGRGTVPETVPDSFPIPEEAVIGATLVDANRGVTEMVMTLPASFSASVDYYAKNLPIGGYELTSSGGSEIDWEFIFFDEDLHGVVGIKAESDGVSTVRVQLTES